MFTDSHAHVYKDYYDNIDFVVDDAKKNGITRIITCGCSGEENREVIDVINNYPTIFGALGIHPENVLNYKCNDIDFIKKNIINKKVVAIGEIGLDYHYSKEEKEEQIKLLETQLSLAEEYDIPVIIHSRDATLDTLTTLKKYKCRGVIHSYSGSLETAQEYIKMGYLLGVNGVITFKNANIKDIIKELPLTSIILETDSPYLTPVPFRGEKNSPKNVLYVAKFVADLKNISLEELSKITNQNIERVFDKIY